MILVVDDDKSLTKLVSRLLEDAGHEVLSVHDGQAAYVTLGEHEDCAAVILDMHMPNINGAELLMLLAADGIEVPVLVMAAFEDFESDEITSFPNVKGFFPKPFYPEALLEKVEELVGKPDA